MKKFVNPEIEITRLNGVDILTTSGGGQINFISPQNQINPTPDSPANQKDWEIPTFNFNK